MKKYFSGIVHRFGVVLFLALAGGTGLSSCSKDDSSVNADYSATDEALIKKYLTDNNITTAQRQSSGLYLVPVVTNANAPIATTGQVVSMLYTGQLLNGTVFGASSQQNNYPLNFILGNNSLLPGIEQGVALMHKGDKAVLLIPSGLAYGPDSPSSTIPANSVLRFEVEVTDLNPNFKVPDDYIITKYLADNKITTAQKQPSGLYYVPGTTNPSGPLASVGKTASVLYTGRFVTGSGSIFDASSQHGNVPFDFVVGKGQVIPGWDEGIALMRKGEKGQLLIPSALAYGSRGSTTIPANTVLRFDVEVTDVK
jgi:FKBP-type peptidyl-prolyl cis-trans isomerase